MFAENFYTLRKANGYTQEELAIRLNVVRQTVSKWEKGLSVPPSDMLSKIADIFEVSVNDLLEDKIEAVIESNALLNQLSRINEHLAIRNRRSLCIWRAIAITVIALCSVSIVVVIIGHMLKVNRIAGYIEEIKQDGIIAEQFWENYVK